MVTTLNSGPLTHQLILRMSSPLCWGCLARTQPSSSALRSPALTRIASFHTTSARAALPAQRKKDNRDSGPKFRERRSVIIQRKNVAKRSPMQPGEVRAARERIVLGNANALPVSTVKDLTVENMADKAMRGKVLSLPMKMLDRLKATKAFKTTQKWGLFLRPATLIREETLELAQAINDISKGDKKNIARIVNGTRGTGKSLYLTQAMTMAFLKGWVVLSVPEAQDLVNGHTAYAPLDNTKPTKYVQKDAASQLLHRMVYANAPVLSTLNISQKHPNLRTLRPNATLETLAYMGVDDPSLSWTVLQALWSELTATAPASGIQGMKPFKTRPPVMLAVDNIAHWMKLSEYRDADFNSIHAHDILLVDFFLKPIMADAGKVLPNGGAVLYSTSSGNTPNVESFNVLMKQVAARRAGIDEASPEFPRMDPYLEEDQRVLDLFKSCPHLELRELKGLSKEETKGLLEYYALSGLLRERVDDTSISTKWTLSGGGIIGELEKLGLRLRKMPPQVNAAPA